MNVLQRILMKNKIIDITFPEISMDINLKRCLTEREGKLPDNQLPDISIDTFILNGGS